jgi:hypothetical protein
MRSSFFVLILVLSSCNARLYIDQLPGSEGESLSVGESANFLFFTNEPAAESGLRLLDGSDYQVQFTLLSNWIDGDIDQNENGQLLNETGFADTLMPLHSLSILKRSREHRWFELMLYLDSCSRDSLTGVTDLAIDEASGSYTYSASCSGDLKLFVNDSQGFYGNNTGFSNVIITRLN